MIDALCYKQTRELLHDTLRHEAFPCYLFDFRIHKATRPRHMMPRFLQIFTALGSISLSVSALQGRGDRVVAIPACLSPC